MGEENDLSDQSRLTNTSYEYSGRFEIDLIASGGQNPLVEPDPHFPEIKFCMRMHWAQKNHSNLVRSLHYIMRIMRGTHDGWKDER